MLRKSHSGSAMAAIPLGLKWKRTKAKLWSDRYIYLMILPVIIYFVILKYWPMGWLSISFYDYKILKGFSGSEFVGLEHFISFFTNSDFLKLLFNTLIINVYAMMFVFPMPIIFAVLLNELGFKHLKKFTQTVSYLPYFISTVAFAALIMNFLSPSSGILAGIFQSLGMDPIYYLGDPKYFRTILVLSGIWQGTGWNAIVYLSALTGIDQGLYEAAEIDGANRLQRIWHITLPGISTTIIILLILQIGNLLTTNFEKIYLLQNTANLQVSEVLQTYVYKRGLVQSNYSYATAVGLFNSIVSVVLVAFSNKLSRKFSETSLW